MIGAGIVGSAIARELAAYDLDVALLEAGPDVGGGTSKANTAILHTGFDATPGTLEARLVRRGYELLSEYAVATGIPVERTGALLVAWTETELAALPGLHEKAERERVPRVRTRRRRRGVPARSDARPGCTRRTDGARRIDHLHLDRQYCAGDRCGGPRRDSVAQSSSGQNRPPGIDH